jgi:hypothetical protein
MEEVQKSIFTQNSSGTQLHRHIDNTFLARIVDAGESPHNYYLSYSSPCPNKSNWPPVGRVRYR